ncbi:hypothetical protein FK531_05755 [Rhodococcus spelaei]|uniref:Serine/threonine protein kinase n=1 Tax=Rhodococcus spelaei TaxID=2546320 RepID=A0A541BP96_9NOCA|nr:hypothetical protein [Rhodococcus spelaei]TQF74151.1 hypothetical protein FK531_05755 [Rhodococcus spelaei]
MPGALFAAGRYRLLERCDATSDTGFWHAHDLATGQDVALTVVDFAGRGPDAAAAVADCFAGTVWLGRVRSAALAPILDMVVVESAAVVVSEWLPSRTLAEVAAGGPSAAGAAAALLPLARGVQGAHRRPERVVSLDNPNRIRVGMDGTAYLAFPGLHPSATRQEDVRVLGAAYDELTAGTGCSGASSADLVVRTLEYIVAQAEVAAARAEALDAEAVSAAGPDQGGSEVNVRLFVAISVVALVFLGALGWFVGTSLV